MTVDGTRGTSIRGWNPVRMNRQAGGGPWCCFAGVPARGRLRVERDEGWGKARCPRWCGVLVSSRPAIHPASIATEPPLEILLIPAAQCLFLRELVEMRFAGVSITIESWCALELVRRLRRCVPERGNGVGRRGVPWGLGTIWGPDVVRNHERPAAERIACAGCRAGIRCLTCGIGCRTLLGVKGSQVQILSARRKVAGQRLNSKIRIEPSDISGAP